MLVLSDRKQDDKSVYDWLPLIETRAGDAPVIVVINQSDGGKEHLTLQWDKIRYDHKHVIKMVRTSCNKDEFAYASIKALRKLIIETLETSPALREIRDNVPASWIRIKQRIARLADESFVLEYDQFVAECLRPAEQGEPPGSIIDDRAEQRQLLRTLHNLGVVIAHGLKRDDTEIPPNLQILDPNWLTKGIYRILQHQELRDRHGIFTKQDMTRWLDPETFPVRYHDEILRLMQDESIELAVPLDLPDHYLVPQALPLHDINWDFVLGDQCLGFAYQYDPLPSGLLARFIVKTFAHSKDAAKRSRYGVMLEVEDCHVHVAVNEGRNRLAIRVGGPAHRRASALSYAKGVLEGLHQALGLEPEELIPLPDEDEKFVPYDYLKTLEGKYGRTYKFLPEHGSREYIVGDLLYGKSGDDDKPERTWWQVTLDVLQNVWPSNDPWLGFAYVAGMIIFLVTGLTGLSLLGMSWSGVILGLSAVAGLVTTGFIIRSDLRYIFHRLAAYWLGLATIPVISEYVLGNLFQGIPFIREFKFTFEPSIPIVIAWVVIFAILAASALFMTWLDTKEK